MSITTVYRVLKTNGELAGEYVDKKLADAHDQKLDGIYAISELIEAKAPELSVQVVEAIAEHLVDNKSAVLAALKKIKDIASEEKPATKSNPNNHSNIETLEPKQIEPKQVANG